MKTTSNRQKGFSIVEVVIVLVVVAILGGLGYVLLNRPNQTATTSTPSTTKAETQRIQSDLSSVDIDKEIDTSTVDEALE